jgi:hypothetical protein
MNGAMQSRNHIKNQVLAILEAILNLSDSLCSFGFSRLFDANKVIGAAGHSVWFGPAHVMINRN